MKVFLKPWFLYGTLFSALGFVISGSDPQLEGHIQFSSLREPNAAQQAEAAVAAGPVQGLPAAQRAKLSAEREARAKAAGVKTPAQIAEAARVAKAEADRIEAEKAAQAAKPALTPPKEVEITTDTAATDEVVAKASANVPAPGSPRTDVQRGNVVPETALTRTAPGRTTGTTQTARPVDFTEYTTTIDSKTYQVNLMYRDGKTKAVFFENAEGKDCKDCRGARHDVVFTGENAHDFEQIKRQLEKDVIPAKIKEAKAKQKLAEENGDDEENADRGLVILTNKINKACKHLDGNAELECKTKKFIDVLKADKKLSKNKKGVKSRLIKDSDAKTYFNAELKTYLQDLLTHKFQIPEVSSALSDLYETRSVINDYNKEKREALKEKTQAKNLIKELMRGLDGEYKETRAEVTHLYKDSLESQADEVRENLRNARRAKASDDVLGFRTNMGSYIDNFEFLRSLNGDLYGTMTDSLNFAKRNGLVPDDSYREMQREIADTRFAILRDFINNDKLLQTGSILDSASGIVSNRDRGQRGNTGVTSGTTTGSGLIRNGSRVELLRGTRL